MKLADCGNGSLSTSNWNPAFTAPEIQNNQACNAQADVYSFGVVLWTIMAQRLPTLQHSHVAAGRREIIPRDCPDTMTSLIKQCWAQNPEERPDMSTIMQELINISHLSAK